MGRTQHKAMIQIWHKEEGDRVPGLVFMLLPAYLNISNLPKTSLTPQYCLPAITYLLFYPEWVNLREGLQQDGGKAQDITNATYFYCTEPGQSMKTKIG